MNVAPTFSTPLAVILALAAAFMWGTWFITLKYLGTYPLEAFYLTLFSTSLVLVWAVGLALDGQALLANIKWVWQADPSRVWVTFICGILYVTGILFALRAMQTIGLAISQPLQASINVIIGTLLSFAIGGVPKNLTPLRIALAVGFLMAAIWLTVRAGSWRENEPARSDKGENKDALRKSIPLLVLAAVFGVTYSLALSYGLKSVTQPAGLAVMPYIVTLATGAWTGALMICGSALTRRKQWNVFRQAGFNIHKLGILSGLAHYGGNIIHTFATRNLSSVISWPLGVTAGLWTQVWGLVYGEFKGAPKRSYVLLFGGFACYMIGAMIISNIF